MGNIEIGDQVLGQGFGGEGANYIKGNEIVKNRLYYQPSTNTIKCGLEPSIHSDIWFLVLRCRLCLPIILSLFLLRFPASALSASYFRCEYP